MTEIIECVPNFSEGRDQNIIRAITSAIENVKNVKLLDVDPGADTNRTVVTFVGDRKSVVEGALAGIARAAELIDMRYHSGAHARIGATDVCPLVPVSGISVEECVALSHRLAQRVAEELRIPVYLYEKSAQKPERIDLANIRAGEYEGLEQKLRDPNWQPDYGQPVFNPKSGATVIGVREFLIAYNVNLNTRDRKLANDIALTIREKGRVKRDRNGDIIRDEKGESVYELGLLKNIKAVGWYIEEYKMAQVSINLTDYNVTPPHVVFETIRRLATEKGLRVTGSELVGLIPKEAILMAGRFYLRQQGKSEGAPESEIIRLAVHSLGLNEIAPFDPAKKIIEYRFPEFEKPLIGQTVREFADELSTASPAPGGGSVSALCGALAASLTAMVANLTHGKKGYEKYFRRMNDYAVKAQELKAELLALVDRDTAAFNVVMNCYRMPKKAEGERTARDAAIKSALKNATAVPLMVMQTTMQVLELTRFVAHYGNLNSLSDAGVAALAALAAIDGAHLNVLTNLPGTGDEQFAREKRRSADEISRRAHRMVPAIIRRIKKEIS